MSSSDPAKTTVDALLNTHFVNLSRNRASMVWAFYPEEPGKHMHVVDGEPSNGAKFVVCQACHPAGLTAAEAAKLAGIKQSGVFKYHWRTGQRSLTEHVEKRHSDLLDVVKAEKAARVSGASASAGASGAAPAANAPLPEGAGTSSSAARAPAAAAAASTVIAARAGVKRLRGDGVAPSTGGMAPPIDALSLSAAAAAAAALVAAARANTAVVRPAPVVPPAAVATVSGIIRADPRVVDLRSDTVTKPTERMRLAMAEAEVGDDVFGDDPTVDALERHMAKIFGKEAAVFVPSGTMGNLIAVGVHCEIRGSEYICGDLSHITQYEQGGTATLMGAHPRQLANRPDGTIDLDKIEAAIRANDQHFPVTRVVCLENTHNKCGGRVLPTEYVDKVVAACRSRGVATHMDGARVWNAAAALGLDPARLLEGVDSASVCLSKGLGAPVGSVILGTAAFAAKCRRLRKACGGTMRQAGTLAAAALAAHDEIFPKIPTDHLRMTELASGLQKIRGIRVQRPVQTNICFVHLDDAFPVAEVVERLGREAMVRVVPWVGNSVRLVTHHQIDRDACAKVLRGFESVLAGMRSDK
jgi:threonine aldolase